MYRRHGDSLCGRFSFVRTSRFVSSLSFLRKCSSVLRSSFVELTHRFSVDVKFGYCVSAELRVKVSKETVVLRRWG